MQKHATKDVAVWVIRHLRDAGHEALLAGGCVRDMLLGIRPIDYDVATSATPMQVKALFRRVRMIGAKFGVAMVIRRGRPVEVATFRNDLSYTDGRRPDAVEFTSAREDAQRRDFTINGMFYDPLEPKLVDYVGGKKDLKARTVRAIGDADKRFAEDYLRMLRAVRFANRLGFTIEAKTAAAIRLRADHIARISGERIRDEFEKMLVHPSAAAAVAQMKGLCLLPEILPELFADADRYAAALRRIEAVAAQGDLMLALGALLGGLTKGEIGRIARRWGGSNDCRDGVQWMAAHLGHWPDAADLPLCDFKRLMAPKHFGRLRTLWRADELAATGARTQSRRIARRAAAIPHSRISPRPFVTGDDLIQMGVSEGLIVGRALKAVYDAQLNEELRDRRSALAMAKELVGA